MILYLVDQVAALRLTTTVAQKCDKSRKLLKQAIKDKKSEEKEEKMLTQKREQEKIEKERIKRMTPEEQQKYEEKQRKKDQKRAKGKMMKIQKV